MRISTRVPLLLLGLVFAPVGALDPLPPRYLCDASIPASLCPQGTTDSLRLKNIPYGIGEAISRNSAASHMAALNAGKVHLTLVSGRSLTVRDFTVSVSGFKTTRDTIPFQEISSVFIQGGFDPGLAALLFIHVAGILTITGAAFDGIQYVVNGDKSLKPTAGFALSGVVVGGVLAAFARKRFDLYVQPVVLDTNAVPY
jgi:hypothetical protein